MWKSKKVFNVVLCDMGYLFGLVSPVTFDGFLPAFDCDWSHVEFYTINLFFIAIELTMWSLNCWVNVRLVTYVISNIVSSSILFCFLFFCFDLIWSNLIRCVELIKFIYDRRAGCAVHTQAASHSPGSKNIFVNSTMTFKW